MKHTIYHVVWRDKRWHLRRAGARRSAATFTDKKLACFYAVLQRSTVFPLQVIVHWKSGRIQHGHLYRRDPRCTVG